MSEDERRLVTLLQDAVPEAQVAVTFDDLRQARRRQRRTSFVVVATAAAVAIAVPAVWWATSPDGIGTGDVATLPTTSPTTAPADPSSGCPATEPVPRGQGVDIDYVDFVRFEGREYLAGMDGDVSVAPGELWTVLGTVTCTISDLTESGDRITGSFLDGNAAFLPVGTVLRAVSGYDQACRIAARVDGELRVYLAHHEVDNMSKARPCALEQSPEAPTVTPCDELPAVPQGIEINTWLDEEHGLFEYSYGSDNSTFRIAYGEDPTCTTRPDVKRILQHARDAG